MIRQNLKLSELSQRNRTPGRDVKAEWTRKSDLPLAVIVAWLAALALTTEGLMTFQNLYG